MGGALLTATAIQGVVPILHASAGCGGSVYFNQLGSTGYLGAGYCGGMAVPSTNVSEREIVFGGHERLVEQIENTLPLVKGDLYVVLTGCMTEIIGDDVRATVRQFADEGACIIAAETGGFKGDGYAGYDILLRQLAREFVQPQEEKSSSKVNLLGIVPGQDAFWRGNINQLTRLLSQLGIEVNAFFGEHDSLEGIRGAASAALTVVASPFYGLEAAEALEEIHEVPFISLPFPIGPTQTSSFLAAVGERLGLPSSEVRRVTDDEEGRFYKYVERFADSYNDLDFQRYAIVVGDGNYAPALTGFLADDLGWLPELTVVTDFRGEERMGQVEEQLSSLRSGYRTKVVYETDASLIGEHLARHWERYRGQRFYDAFSPAFVVGSHLEREFAKNIKAAHLTVTYPVGNRVVLDRGYAGYEGSLRLIEDLLSVVVADR